MKSTRSTQNLHSIQDAGDRVVADQADVAALGAFEAEIHEIAPAALAPSLAFRHLAIVLDDRDDITLLRQPANRAIGGAAIHDQIFDPRVILREHTADGFFDERGGVESRRNDAN